MSVPSVSVGLRKSHIFIIPTFSPGPGTYVHKGPVRESSPMQANEIGKCVLEGLADFENAGMMPDWSKYQSPVLEVAGVTRWSEYERGLKSCVVDKLETYLLIRGGNRGPIQIPIDANAEEIGEGVLLALGASPKGS